MNSIQKAISIMGGPSAAARELSVTPQAICFWRDGKREVPADKCPDIERSTKGAVRCEELRPNVDWAFIRGTKKKAA